MLTTKARRRRAFLFCRLSAIVDSAVVFAGAIEERLDASSQAELFRQIGRFVEIGAKPFRLGQVVIAQAGLDAELGILPRQRAHPLFHLPAAVLVANAVFQIGEQRGDDAGEDLRALLLEWL